MPFTSYGIFGSVETEIGPITMTITNNRSGVTSVAAVIPVFIIDLEIKRHTELTNVPFANMTFGTVAVDYYNKYDENGGIIKFEGLIKITDPPTTPATTTAWSIINYINSTSSKYIYATLIFGPSTGHPIATNYNKCKCVHSALHTGDIGGARVVYGSLTFTFAYTTPYP